MTELTPKEKLDAQALGTALGNRHVLKSVVELAAMLNPQMGDALAQRWSEFTDGLKGDPKIEPHLDAIYGHMIDTIEECTQVARQGAHTGREIISEANE